MKVHRFVLSIMVVATSVSAAYAQRYNDPRIDSMQEEIQAIREELNAGGGGTITAGGGGSASLSVKISDMEDQLRQFRGMIEEIQHRQSRIEADMKSLNEDVDFRLRALEERSGMTGAPGAAATGPTGVAPTPTLTPPQNGTPAPPIQPVPTPQPLSQNGIQPVPTTPSAESNADTSSVQNYASSKEQYDAAFKLMNQAKYAEAGAVLESFTKRYPKDPLIGNVYYWLGETYYVRENYLKSADNFRQGFETMPEGIKAPDNLFKLALSLNMLNKKRESCVVLKQLQIKYQGSSSPVLQKAANKEKELGCTH
ncbi:MAG: tol-pal system protein YbgF [Rickettsiales bacterium]